MVSSEALESTLLYKKVARIEKSLWILLLQLLKLGITVLQEFFDLSIFYLVKLISQPLGMPEFSGKQNPGTENFQTERSRMGKFWDQKIPGIPFFPGIQEIFF